MIGASISKAGTRLACLEAALADMSQNGLLLVGMDPKALVRPAPSARVAVGRFHRDEAAGRDGEGAVLHLLVGCDEHRAGARRNDAAGEGRGPLGGGSDVALRCRGAGHADNLAGLGPGLRQRALHGA